jgi:hypothetical protein
MKHLLVIALALVWLGCLVEFTALASIALRTQNVGSVGAIGMMMGWLGLTGFCAWKLTRRSHVATQV